MDIQYIMTLRYENDQGAKTRFRRSVFKVQTNQLPRMILLVLLSTGSCPGWLQSVFLITLAIKSEA